MGNFITLGNSCSSDGGVEHYPCSDGLAEPSARNEKSR